MTYGEALLIRIEQPPVPATEDLQHPDSHTPQPDHAVQHTVQATQSPEQALPTAENTSCQPKSTEQAIAAVAIQANLDGRGVYTPPAGHTPAQYTPDQWGKWKRGEDGKLYKTSATGRSKNTDDLFGMFLDDIAGFAVLTKEEEKELAQKMEAGRLLLERLDGKPATTEEDENTIAAARAARTKFICSNFKLLASVAAKLKLPPGKEPIDLVANSYFELERHVDSFNGDLDLKFSTRTTPAIRWEMLHYLNTFHGSITISDEAGDIYSAGVRRALGDLDALTPENRRLHWLTHPLSLLEPAVDSQNNSAQLVDLIPDPNADSVEVSMLASLRRELVYEILDKLSPLERAVLLRYRMPHGTEKVTHKTITKEFGFSSEDVARNWVTRAGKNFRRLASQHPSAEVLDADVLKPETLRAKSGKNSGASAEAA